MNRVHNLICSSSWWGKRVERELLPWALADVELGEEVLEFGPGFGATTRVLAERVARLTALELDADYCRRLRQELPAHVAVLEGDATNMPFADASFDGVLCFTMLHHIPEPGLQDLALAEAARVLRPGGVFAGTDSIGSGWLFRAIHVGDTLNLIDPDTFGDRLSRAGFERPQIDSTERSFRFTAVKPA